MNNNGWDSKFHEIYYPPLGRSVEVFTRTAFAKALNRQVNTIRAMERDNVLCHPRLRDGRGWWLYTRDQIEDMVALAESEGVISPQKRKKFSARFSKEAKRILKRPPR